MRGAEGSVHLHFLVTLTEPEGTAWSCARGGSGGGKGKGPSPENQRTFTMELAPRVMGTA